jgi:hypothetical protein
VSTLTSQLTKLQLSTTNHAHPPLSYLHTPCSIT